MLLDAIDTEKEKLTLTISKLDKFFQDLPENALIFGAKVLLAAVLFFVGIKLIGIIRKIIKKSLNKANVELGVIQFVDGLVKVILYILLIAMIATNFGFDATSMLALLGTAGVTIGLALQGGLSNLVGGLLILLIKPFKVGDYILENGSGKEGTVKEIGIFYTKLQTVDHKTVVLPNGNLANNSIENYTHYGTRRVDMTVGISYHADIQKAKAIVKEVIDQHPLVLHNHDTKIFVDSLGASEVVIGFRPYCKNTDYWTVKWDLLEQVKMALDEANIEIPFQQIDVHMIQEDK